MKPKWTPRPLGEFLAESSERVAVRDDAEYRQVTVAMRGRGVRLRQTIKGADIKTKSQYVARAGQFIYSRIDARNGAMGIVPPELDGALVTGDFPTFTLNTKLIHPRFFAYLASREAFIEKCKIASRGVTNRKRLKEPQFLSIEVDLPEPPEQERIAARLDAFSARLTEARRLHDQLADEQQEFVAALARPDLTDAEKEAAGWRRTRLSQVLTERVEPVTVEKDKEYPTIGVYSFARGIIRKLPIVGSETKATTFYRVRAGQFIYGRLGGYEGAFAFVPRWADGAYVSGEFPVFDCNLNEVLPEYLFAYFNSPRVWETMSDACRGLAGRRIRLKESAFLAHELFLPPIGYQRSVRDILSAAEEARTLHNNLPDELNALQSALLEQAFRGEL